jgi:hypothetical protein
MRWDLILPALATLLGTLTGLQVREKTSPEKQFRTQLKAKLEFNVSSCVDVGEAEIRYEPGSPATNLIEQVVLHKEFVLSVKCESYDNGYTKFAPWHLERIATRMNRATSLAALRAVGCSYLGVGPTHDLSGVTDDEGRIFSVGQKDFRFLGVVNDRDTDAPPTGSIGSVELQSIYLYGADGVQLPAPLQVSQTVSGG